MAENEQSVSVFDCPRCGEYNVWNGKGYGGFYIRCDNCGLSTPILPSEDDALSFWGGLENMTWSKSKRKL